MAHWRGSRRAQEAKPLQLTRHYLVMDAVAIWITVFASFLVFLLVAMQGRLRTNSNSFCPPKSHHDCTFVAAYSSLLSPLNGLASFHSDLL